MTPGPTSAPPPVPPALMSELCHIVGRRHVLVGKGRTRRFTVGYRHGAGSVAAVVRPASLIEQYLAFRACVEAGAIVIVQAANTGLTGGSTPDGVYDRPVVLINTMRIAGIRIIDAGRQVICLAGATLNALERHLAPLGREPHSVIGSSCVGASVLGGICNNSGGALIRRGPAYTEAALFVRVTEERKVELIDHLGLDFDGDAIELLAALDNIHTEWTVTPGDARAIASPGYASAVRDIGASTPARYNADPSHLFEASGCAGKIMVLAVRLATFARPARTATFYVGTNDPDSFALLRRQLLTDLGELPILAEYVHRDAFDVAAEYGKDVFAAIRLLGTAHLPKLFALKDRVDRLAARLPFISAHLSDRLLQRLADLLPEHLPPRMRTWRDRFEHHLIVKVDGASVDALRALLAAGFAGQSGDAFECTAREAELALLHRFAVAGAAIRYQMMHRAEVGELVALDIALRRDDPDWTAQVPADIVPHIAKAIIYGHFLCHVFHQDYVLTRTADAAAFKRQTLADLDERGAEYPAEHNVGHMYRAKPALAAHYFALDPSNSLNPGIGGTSRAVGCSGDAEMRPC